MTGSDDDEADASSSSAQRRWQISSGLDSHRGAAIDRCGRAGEGGRRGTHSAQRHHTLAGMVSVPASAKASGNQAGQPEG